LGRKFVRISLGGVRDEAEIRGHRRTYVGAMPGRLIQALKQAGTNNPVVLLDEVDKLGADVRGDPSAALLEVLDPEQNHTFRDHYLGVNFDLSKVMFIATANLPETIPPPLRDRMETLHLSGYAEEEKLAIAERYIIPKQIAEAGLTANEIVIGREVTRRIISEYTRESGLPGQLGDVMKESAQAALSFARAHAVALGLSSEFYAGREIHIHVPAGGVPKDGPAAGVTMACALVSLISGIPVRHDVAMTGELTLRGKVLPIGGLKEKLLAAARAGIKTVLIPAANAHELTEIPAYVTAKLTI